MISFYNNLFAVIFLLAEKLKKDLGLPKENPYSTKNKYKWDINDVIKWCRDNNYSKRKRGK